VIVSIVWGTGLCARREKVKVKITNLDFRTQGAKEKLRVYLAGEIRRPGGRAIRTVNRFELKPDSALYNKLRAHFCLPDNGLITYTGPLTIPGDNRRKPLPRGPADYEPVQPASSQESNTTQGGDVQSLTSRLNDTGFELGLVWDDTEKIMWKKISKRDFGKWV
jgi:hypothetical protein